MGCVRWIIEGLGLHVEIHIYELEPEDVSAGLSMCSMDHIASIVGRQGEAERTQLVFGRTADYTRKKLTLDLGWTTPRLA